MKCLRRCSLSCFSNRSPWTLLGLLWLLGGYPPAVGLGQKPPGLGYAYPPAVAVGQETEVQLGGFDFTPDMQWFVHDDQVRLETSGPPGDFIDPPPPYWTGPRAAGPALPIPREVPARFHVPAESPSGLVRWQVANANGSSSTAMLYVSREPEMVESRSRDFAQRLPELPVAVSGRLSRLTEVDRYEVSAEQSGLICVDLMARRLGSDFQGVVEVFDATGKLVADLCDTQGLDGSLCFAATGGEIYEVSIRDADFRGDRSYIYRLAFSLGPRVVCTLPAKGQRGDSIEMMVVGYGLASGRPELEHVSQAVTFPTSDSVDHVVIPVPTAAGEISLRVPLSDLRECTPRAPELTQESTNRWKLSSPVAVTAQLPVGVDEHCYVWQVEKDQYWQADVRSQAIGGRLDVSVAILDPAGQLVSEVDDVGGTSDAQLEFRAADSGLYSCVVRSVSSGTGAADEVYRLELTQSAPDFSLTVPQQVNIPLGGATELTIQAERIGGFAGEIAVAMRGELEGVTPEGVSVIPADGKEVKVKLQAAADAAVRAGVIQFAGIAELAGVERTHLATAVASGNLSPRSPSEKRVVEVLAAMTMPAPFEVRIVDRDRQHEVSRGTTFLAEVEIVRKAPIDGAAIFAGPVRLETSAHQQRYRAGIRSNSVEVQSEQQQARFPCFMPEWLATDLTQRMLIHGVAIVPDPKGNPRYLTQAGDARITMIMEGALLKLSTLVQDPLARAGERVEIPVSVLRSPTFPAAATIELSVPEEAAGLIVAEPLVLGPGEDRGVVVIESIADPRVLGPWALTLTATAYQQERWPVVSELELVMEFTAAEVSPAAPLEN